MIYSHSAGGVVISPEGRILVVSQKGSSWSLPKGHVEEGEEVLEAAKREIFEESGISDLQFIKELGSYKRHPMDGPNNQDDPNHLKTLTFFLFKTTQMNLTPQDPENPEARWVAKEEVPNLLTHPKDKEFFQSILPIF